MAEIIRSYVPFDKSVKTKFRKYTLSDDRIFQLLCQIGGPDRKPLGIRSEFS